MPGYIVFSALNLIAFARFAGDFSWNLPGLWAYVFSIASMLGAGIYGALQIRRAMGEATQ